MLQNLSDPTAERNKGGCTAEHAGAQEGRAETPREREERGCPRKRRDNLGCNRRAEAAAAAGGWATAGRERSGGSRCGPSADGARGGQGSAVVAAARPLEAPQR